MASLHPKADRKIRHICPTSTIAFSPQIFGVREGILDRLLLTPNRPP